MQVGDVVRVVGHTHVYFGFVGRITQIFTPDEWEKRSGWKPSSNTFVLGVPVRQGRVRWEFDCEHNPAVETVAQDSELQVVPEDTETEPFWLLYRERMAAHRSSKHVCSRANSACNRWRNHRQDYAVKLARSCHALNLAIAAKDQPHEFKNKTRLSLEGLVELCRAAGKDMELVADIIFHLHFSDREPREVAGLLPRCSCATQMSLA